MMIDALAFLVALPLSVELLGAACAVLDARHHLDLRAAALERLAVPLLAAGILWWLIGAAKWPLLVAAVLLAFLCHIVWFYVTRWLLRRPGAQTVALDTESDDS